MDRGRELTRGNLAVLVREGDQINPMGHRIAEEVDRAWDRVERRVGVERGDRAVVPVGIGDEDPVGDRSRVDVEDRPADRPAIQQDGTRGHDGTDDFVTGGLGGAADLSEDAGALLQVVCPCQRIFRGEAETGGPPSPSS